MSDTDTYTDNKWYVFFVATLTAFMVTFTGSSINVALPSIEREFNMDTILLGWIVTAYILTTTIFIIPCGRLADLYGRKRIFTSGVIIHTIASTVLTFTNSSLLLIVLRVVQGIGSALYFSTGVAMLVSAFPVEERGRALGANAAAVYLGLSMGPFLGGILTGYLGWRSIFWINIPLGVIITILTVWKVKNDRTDTRGETFDIVGAILLGLMLASLVYGFSSLPSVAGLVCIVASIIIFPVFYRWETRVTSPLLHMDMFRKNRSFTLYNATVLINYSATYATAFLMSLYLQYNKGFSPQLAGLIMVSQPIVQTAFSPLAGRISDKIKPYVLSSTGMVIIVIGLTSLAFLNEGTGLVFIVGSLAFLGLGLAFFISPITNAVMSSAEKKDYGIASAIFALMRQVGIMFSMGIVMMIFSLYMGKVQITPEQHVALLQSVKIAFIVFAAISLAAVWAVLIAGRSDRTVR
jgi:EmrB/QacA subfamily drug resistance transporter